MLTDLASSRSACCGVWVALAALLAVLGSNWSECVIVAVFVCEPGLMTVAWTTSVAGEPTLTVPTVQIPLAGSYVPWLGVAETKETPAARASCAWTPVAGSGPLLVRVMV